jgi:NAD(P)-dependent dehydrogenase (short-subunit alcohol dehydrogenase family)
VGIGMRQNNKTALVTGASRGIGRATALALAETGAEVLVRMKLAAPNVVFMIMQPDWKKAGRSTDPLARAQMQYSSRIKIQKRDLRQ